MVQSVKRLALDFSACHDPRVMIPLLWDQAPLWAPRSVGSELEILSLSFTLPFSLSLKINFFLSKYNK